MCALHGVTNFHSTYKINDKLLIIASVPPQFNCKHIILHVPPTKKSLPLHVHKPVSSSTKVAVSLHSHPRFAFSLYSFCNGKLILPSKLTQPNCNENSEHLQGLCRVWDLTGVYWADVYFTLLDSLYCAVMQPVPSKWGIQSGVRVPPEV